MPGGPPPGAGLGPPPGFGLYPLGGNPAAAGLNPLERERLERLGMAGGMGGPMGAGAPGNGGGPGDPMGSAEAVNRLQAERIHAERFAMAADQLRLQMAGAYCSHLVLMGHRPQNHCGPSLNGMFLGTCSGQDMPPPPGFPLNAGYPRPPPGLLGPQDGGLGGLLGGQLLGRGLGLHLLAEERNVLDTLQLTRITEELVAVALSLHLPQDVDSVVISQCSTHLIIVHAQMIFLNAPEPGQPGRVNDFEDSRLLVLPLYVGGVSLPGVVQQLLQEVPEQPPVGGGGLRLPLSGSVCRPISGCAGWKVGRRPRWCSCGSC